jgi:exopolysaccharide biosynthesis polyprenyl glycosylphosphotransferase
MRHPGPDTLVVRASSRVVDPHGWLQIQVPLYGAALYLAAVAVLLAAPRQEGSASYWVAVTFPLVTLAVWSAWRGWARSTSHAGGQLVAVTWSAFLMIAVGSILGDRHPVGLALWLWLFAVAALGAVGLVLLYVRQHLLRVETLATPTLVVGAGVVGRQLVTRLLRDACYGLKPVAFLDPDPMPGSDGSRSTMVPVVGGIGDLAEAVAFTGARRVILAFSGQPDHVLVGLVRECQQLGIEVSLVPRMFESIGERTALDHVGGIPLLTLRETNPRGWQFACKHTLDRSLAFCALTVLSPLLLAIAALVRLSSSGPALFRQRRVGRDGRVFNLLKFRTMYLTRPSDEFEPPAGIAPGGIEGEDRCTRLGRWLRRASLDELPQLFNVLRGDMSLVGPRPERPEFVERFAAEVRQYENRHRVKSGITGWAQVHGLRGQTSIADRVELDNYYIRNWSLMLDLRIMALTIAEILRFRG